MMNAKFRFKKSVNLWLFNFEKIKPMGVAQLIQILG